ncbi:MAG: hypothetical protein FJW23_06840 [Acidimicrobiia bacterium]|nr:hypothetical protein [Acidimicrobiia bacterium]
MKVLFAFSHPGFLRNFESGLRHLLARGHRVHVHFDRDVEADSVSGTALQVLDRLRSAGSLSSSSVPPQRNEWSALASALRAARDYWRYLDSEYDDAPLLRGRARAETPAFAVGAEGVCRQAPLRRGLDGLVHGLERRLPIPPDRLDLLREHAPDVLVVTPLVYFRSEQVTLLRAAAEMRIPSVYAAGSWDHLTTKGLVHEVPDLTLVWNDAQVEECVRWHGLQRAQCRAVGAQAFDHWFGREPAVDRATFCRMVGVPDDRPLLLYLCSSTFIAGDERPAVREWLAAVRAAADPLGRAAVLVRPHPQNAAIWKDERFDDGLTVVWPRDGANPIGEMERSDYFHSLYCSDAVVGVNTSAQIESAIVGRPVFSLLSARYAGTQGGTLHFRHLQRAGGGLLHTADSLEALVRQLAAALAGDHGRDEASARFVRAFVRPGGVDREAGAAFAEAVEGAVGARRPRRRAVGLSLLRPIAAAAGHAGSLRATTAPVRFQSWFVPAGPALIREARVSPARRPAMLAATPEDVQSVAPWVAAVAGRGGRSLLAVPDGSPASAAARAIRDRLPRCTIVAWPVAPEQLNLLMTKFRPDRLWWDEASVTAEAHIALCALARRLAIPTGDADSGDEVEADSRERVG